MNAKLTVKVVALGLLAVRASDAGLELPDGMDAEIDELIAAADDFATDIPNDEAAAALTDVITEMLDAIKAELSASETEEPEEAAEDYRTYYCAECDNEVTVERGTYAEDNDMCPSCWRAYQGG
jgi:formylmethanofuran dehydrogenase subunit E